MAVYEHRYKPYVGSLDQQLGRGSWSFHVTHMRILFQLRFFIALYALCFVAPLVFTILIYLHHNVTALAVISDECGRPNSNQWRCFSRSSLVHQSGLAFLMTVIIGPVLISRDLSNNGLPLYLCRPFTRAEYILGKMAVLGPAALKCHLGAGDPALPLPVDTLAGAAGCWTTGGSVVAILGGTAGSSDPASWRLLAMAFSAWLKWRTAASAALLPSS
jgi:ABC-2 type transport system permease protein